MLTDRDLPTLQAAASALRHAPPAMRAAHLAEKLEEIAGRHANMLANMPADTTTGGDDADTDA